MVAVSLKKKKRDAHLRSPDFFDAERHPFISFSSKRVVGGVNGAFKLVGDLTMRGVRREIALDVTSEGSGTDPYGNERMGFSARGTVNRQDFGLTWNMALEAGGVAVSDEVKISIDVELVRPIA